MKNKLKLKSLFFGLLISFVFIGCSKDNNESPETSGNFLKYNNIEYPTPNGMLVFKELINNNLCLYDLKIYSSNFTFNSTTGDVTGINGTGQIITFYAISPIHVKDVNADGLINKNDIVLSNLVLEEGQYLFSSAYISKTFEADFTISAKNTGDNSVYSMKSGVLNISKSGDVYEIKYNGIGENDIAISGFFNGNLNLLRNQ